MIRAVVNTIIDDNRKFIQILINPGYGAVFKIVEIKLKPVIFDIQPVNMKIIFLVGWNTV